MWHEGASTRKKIGGNSEGLAAPTSQISSLGLPEYRRHIKKAEESIMEFLSKNFAKLEGWLSSLTKLKVNIPHVEALKGMPKYSRHLEDLLKKKVND
ncbi:hypothetical protein Tco_0183917 [Tanacetum coccineum]